MSFSLRHQAKVKVCVLFKFLFLFVVFVFLFGLAEVRMGKHEGFANKEKRKVHDIYVKDKIDCQLLVVFNLFFCLVQVFVLGLRCFKFSVFVL